MANEEHLSILKQGVKVWNRWYKKNLEIKPDISGVNLIEIDLSSINLIGANLRDVDLREANLSFACLIGVDLNGANLTGIDLREANLKGAYLYRVNLYDADLSGADLSGANLSNADLSNANLSGSDLSGTNLTGVNFKKANLRNANLVKTCLNEADLHGADIMWSILTSSSLISANFTSANLSFARLIDVDLNGANLRSANLSYTDFRSANLNYADIGEAIIGWSNFVDVDLGDVKELETVKHQGPSYIDIHTIYKSKGNIPEVFLRGAGVPDTFITFMKSLTGVALDFYSCFISHSSHDKAFVERLYADLQAKGVRCWYAPEDLKIGEPFLLGIEQGIRLHDKLLLVLSEHSVASGWVQHEVLSAMAKEQGKEPWVLFPIRVDDAIMNTDVTWATMIKQSRHIGDFTHWKDHDAYQKAFERLLRDLKAQG